MDDLELGSDEKVLAPAQMVHIKSASFEAVLTNKRIILVDRIKDTHPKKNILLTTIKDFEQGENTLHEKVITFTLLTTTGETRQMVLTIDRQTVSDPGHKADEWVTALKNYVPEAGSPPVEKAMRMQVPGQSRPDYTGDLGELKKIEIARPIKDQDGHEPSATKPAEITSLTKGFFSSPARTNDVVPEGERADSAAAEKIPPAPVASPVPDDHKGRTLEQIIHSMGPIGGDAESLTESAPAVPESAPIPMAEPVPAVPHTPPAPSAPREMRLGILAAGVIIIVILAIAAGGFIVMKDLQNPTVVQPVTTPQPTVVTMMPTPTLSPVVTAAVTTESVPQTTQLLIPETGVWVEISYDQNYTGWVGSPNTHQDVTDTGDHLYQVVTTDQAAAVSVQKMDGSGDELKVTVYNNGEAVKTASTTQPNGIIDLQVSFVTPTPTPTPVLTPIPTLPVPSNAIHEVNAST
ncbi:hypothetical protein [Methanoregula sp.]|uniref:hypothetical protein n=1 Tax=Methanoregula sp. TaxID=2052170 RepID=UPI003BB03A15